MQGGGVLAGGLLVAVAATGAHEVPVMAPVRDWAALCHQVFKGGDEELCFRHVRGAFRETFPAVVVDWDGCRDRQAAERWGWVALMERGKAAESAEAVKRACERR